MQQWGYKLGGSVQIDNLIYRYFANSNRLKSVSDLSGATTNTGLGDFYRSTIHPSGSSPSGFRVDYTYDVDGNMVKDWNKDIGDASTDGITYNYMHLPMLIKVKKTATTEKGTIEYIYDAAGNKLEKIVRENVAVTTDNPSGKIIKTTTYLNGFIYEAVSPAPVSGTTNPLLQFFGHEEGRVRLKRTTVNSVTSTSYVVDYMLKDHLGNVRTVLTDEQQKDIYQATMETAAQAFEVALFGTLVQTKAVVKPVGFDTDAANARVCRLRPMGSTSPTSISNPGTADIGPGVMLKVMAGDKINAQTYFWQSRELVPANNNTNTDIINVLLGALTGNLSAASGGKLSATDISSNSGIINSSVTSFLSSQAISSNTEAEKVYLSWILLDEQQLKLVSSGSGFVGVDPNTFTPGNGKVLLQANGGQPINIPKNGYLYVYVSSEVRKIDAYFDDIRVEHVRGALVEENAYTSWGSVAKGISSNAANKLENKYKYNGKELQSKEFSDGSGLEEYDYGARHYNAQIGRFMVQDRFADKYFDFSPYSYTRNNPISNIDVNGDSVWTTTNEDGVKTLHVTGTVIDMSKNKLTNEQLTDAAARIASSITEAYTSNDPDNVLNVDVQITVSNSVKDTKKTDHVFAFYEKGDLPDPNHMGKKMHPEVSGVADFGQKGIALSKSILESKPTTDPNNGYYGTGLDGKGASTLERTSAHKFGHSLGLGHEDAPPGSLMRQSSDKDPGMKITNPQSKEFQKNIKDGNVNGKRRFYL
jgi:RHS repeat-associated protein